MKRSAVSQYSLSILLVIVFTMTIGVHGTRAAELPPLLEKITVGVNGELWKRATALFNAPIETKLVKFTLLKGVLDGLLFGRVQLRAAFEPEKMKGDDPTYGPIYNTTYAHLMDALDQFYSDYRNEKIYIVWALEIISMELKGVPKETIDQTLADFRRAASILFK